ncbi:hypothetical protein AYO40_03505 [Planctomycetaceae bacterium SCGC AG-212-D15]|nr:hypothetical protein AYO40_03505 [Planctomycetaceae bacterium SCGC AG-212-D15]
MKFMTNERMDEALMKFAHPIGGFPDAIMRLDYLLSLMEEESHPDINGWRWVRKWVADEADGWGGHWPDGAFRGFRFHTRATPSPSYCTVPDAVAERIGVVSFDTLEEAFIALAKATNDLY